MPPSDPAWQLSVLGSGLLSRAGGEPVRTDPKTLALLAYLALEGSQTRAHLSALLWPDTPDSASRNNLVHLLRRLKAASGAELILADGQHLALSPDVQTDVSGSRQGAGAGPPASFLADYDADDAPDLADWILHQRETLQAHWMDAQRVVVTQAEDAGRFQDALLAAEALVGADLLSEEAHRMVMRLHYALGDRPAALRAYHRCKEVLLREVGEEPLPETVRLAREIGDGTLPVAHTDRAIPLSVLRPPTLVGREAEWARMEQAWAAGLGIMVTGAPGSGKSRLAVDFLRSKTTYQMLLFEGRPGDQAAPYTTHARTYRQVLDTYPDLELPGWVRRELGRIIPELREPGTAQTPPLLTEADKVRFYDAKVEVIRQVAERGPVILASDDLQFMDEASIEAGGYVFSKFFGNPDTNLRTLFAFRTGALQGLAAAVAQQMIDAGLAVLVQLEPLDARAVGELLAETEVPGADGLASDLWQVTQGNPQFVLEAVKSMYETRRFTLDHTRATLGGDVAGQISQRLSRLSEQALHAARAAAVLQGGFTLEQVADVLHIGLLDIATAWEELEQAQVTRGERFAHDLLYETVLAQIPPTTRRLLHRSAARVVASHDRAGQIPPGQQAARVAQHWIGGGDPLQAAPWLVRAGEAADATLRPDEAAAFYREAAKLYDEAGQADEAASARAASEAIQTRTAV